MQRRQNDDRPAENHRAARTDDEKVKDHLSPSAHPTEPLIESQPVLWWRLIRDAEELRARTGWGLAGVWELVHHGEYDAARLRLNQLREVLP